MNDYLCAYGHFFYEPREFNERDYDASGHIRDETFVECPICGDSAFEEFSTSWGIKVLKELWDGGPLENRPLISDIIQQLHDLEVGT